MIDSYILESLNLLNTVQWELDTLDDHSEPAISLIYPKENESSKRISEQEAKIVLCHILLKNKVPFSLETPTESKYSFTGTMKRAGNLDVCVYEKNKTYQRAHCIEYKAHNAKTFQSDIEKLLVEKGDNYFVHILPGADNATLYNASTQTARISVINKYINAIKTTLKKRKDHNEIRFSSLTFYICILEPFCIITNTICKTDFDDIDTKLKLEYKIRKQEFSITDAHSNWKVRER